MEGVRVSILAGLDHVQRLFPRFAVVPGSVIAAGTASMSVKAASDAADGRDPSSPDSREANRR